MSACNFLAWPPPAAAAPTPEKLLRVRTHIGQKLASYIFLGGCLLTLTMPLVFESTANRDTTKAAVTLYGNCSRKVHRVLTLDITVPFKIVLLQRLTPNQ